MAWFDVGAGLAEMGKTVSQTMSVAMLEQMKAQNEESRIKLANELATERESRGRKEAHGYDMEKQGALFKHQAEQGDKDRDNRITTTGMSVGGQLASTRMTIEARKDEAAADRKLREREIDDRWIQNQMADRRHAEEQAALSEYRRKNIEATLQGHTKLEVKEEDGTAWRVNPATGKLDQVMGPDGKPMKFKDPLQARALSESLSTSKDQLNQTIRLYEGDLRQAQAELNAALKTTNGELNGDKDPGVIAARRRIEEVEKRYQPKINEYNQRTNALIQHLLKQAAVAAPTGTERGGPSISDFDRSSKDKTPKPGTGLMEQVQ